MASASAKDDATQKLVDEAGDALDSLDEHIIPDENDRTVVYGVIRDLRLALIEAAQRPPVSPEVREAVLHVVLGYNPAKLNPAGRRMFAIDIERGERTTDALLARFSIPSQPVYDEEKIAAHIHARAEFDADECDHGTYRGGPLDGQTYAMCERKAAALVAALRSGELI